MCDLHLIWIGSIIPEKYIENIKKWNNYEYKNKYIWYDSNLIKYCYLGKIKGFEFRDIVKEEILDNDKLKKVYLIESGQKEREIKCEKMINWGMSSDILRLCILKKYEGLYVDMDIIAKKLPESEILEKKYGICYALFDKCKLSNCAIYYKKNEISKYLIEGYINNIIELSNKLYNDYNLYKLYLINPENWIETTLKISGPLAISYKLYDKYINNIELITLPSDYFIEEENLRYEHSWFRDNFIFVKNYFILDNNDENLINYLLYKTLINKNGITNLLDIYNDVIGNENISSIELGMIENYIKKFKIKIKSYEEFILKIDEISLLIQKFIKNKCHIIRK